MKKKNRIRVAARDFTVETRGDAETEMAAVAKLTLERNAIQNMLDDEIVAAREKYAGTLCDIADFIAAKSERLREWAELNPAEFPKGKKSLALSHGTIGFRTGTPKLKTIGRKTWAAVLAAIKSFGFQEWVRTEESVNKEQIIADARDARSDYLSDKLRNVGVAVVQDETFFIEPKLEELTNRITEAA